MATKKDDTQEPEYKTDAKDLPRVDTGSTQYNYTDRTKEREDVETPLTARYTEATSAELNPAFYPKHNKPEALHNEAEKAGADYPGGNQLVAANIAASDEDLDEHDPEVANPAAPSAAPVGTGDTANDGSGKTASTDEKPKTAAKKTASAKDS